MQTHYLTTAEVASQYGVTTATVIQWIKRKLLDGAQKKGRDWLIPPAALADFKPPKRGRPWPSTEK